MQLDIRKRNIPWSDALADYAEQRVDRSLARLSSRVGRVLVRFADVNGPKGGEDMQCAISLRLSSGDWVRAHAQDACPYRAVDSAVSRLKHSVTRQAARLRDRKRRHRAA